MNTACLFVCLLQLFPQAWEVHNMRMRTQPGTSVGSRLRSSGAESADSAVLASVSRRSRKPCPEVLRCPACVENTFEDSELVSKCPSIAKSPRLALRLQSKIEDGLFCFPFWKNLGWQPHFFVMGVLKTIYITKHFPWMSVSA